MRLSVGKKIFLSALFFFIIVTSANSCPVCIHEKLKEGNIAVHQQCFEINGSSLYMQRVGERGPLIIFESGLGDSSGSWDKVVPEVAKFARTITYDRAGLGRSGKILSTERTAQEAVQDLRKLLKKAHLLPPYILVGHSLGGLYMQLFAQKYPDEVMGVVLVDSASHEENMVDRNLPPQDARYYLEAKGMEASSQQVKNAPTFPAIALIVISTTHRGENWLEMQKHLVKLSEKSRHIITDTSGHYLHREEPETVINSIRNIVKQTRESQIKPFITAKNRHDMSGYDKDSEKKLKKYD